MPEWQSPIPAPDVSLNTRMFTSAHASLLTASHDLQVRDEVSTILQSMLSDIETQNTLKSQYNHQTQIQQLQSQLHNCQLELQERRAYQQNSILERQNVGDLFVSELFVLSQTLQELHSWKEQHEVKIQEYDVLKEKLTRAEESIRTFQRSNSLNANANMNDNMNDNMNENTNLTSNNVSTSAVVLNNNSNDNKGTSLSEIASRKEVSNLTISDVPTSTPDPKEQDVPPNNLNPLDDTKKEDPVPNNLTSEEPKPTSPKKSPKSTIKKERTKEKKKEPKKKKKYPKASFTALNDLVLLEIFAFLDAVEVIQSAQVNKAFYTKVNTMFGNVSSVDTPEDSVVLLEEESDSDSDSDSESSSSSSEEDETSSDDEEEEKEEVKPPSSTSIAPTIVALPPKTNSTASFGSSNSSKTQNQARAAMISNNPLSTMFSNMLQPKPNGTAPTNNNVNTSPTMDTSNSITSSTPSQNNPTTSSASTGLTSNMANSMTSKLSPSELSVIISMTEKISRLSAEKEDLSARLEGTEAVKEFLISKVRDAELALAQKSSESLAITQQTSSDQEVISFLDGRVRELERLYKACTSEKSKAVEEIQTLQKQSMKKTKVIEDMLQFERQQLATQETEWKMTKKVLVKEVKHCRAQIATLTAELDSMYHQKERLKQALLSLNGGGGSSNIGLSIDKSPRTNRIVGER